MDIVKKFLIFFGMKKFYNIHIFSIRLYCFNGFKCLAIYCPTTVNRLYSKKVLPAIDQLSPDYKQIISLNYEV